MSFDKVILTHQLLVSLFGKSLYKDTLLHSDVSDSSPDTKLPFLGNNNHHTSIVVNYPGELFLPERHLEFIAKMLSACKMTLADVAIINLKDQMIPFKTLKKQLAPVQMIFFAVEPTALGLNRNPDYFTPDTFDNCTIITLPSLEMINQENPEAVLLKKKLWTCLKQLFNIL
ncbi:MAG TPA: hypothetical protein VM012_04420 [Flavitalea sp.]|nr:hypothetical protein [Flavitalea sp.]